MADACNREQDPRGGKRRRLDDSGRYELCRTEILGQGRNAVIEGKDKQTNARVAIKCFDTSYSTKHCYSAEVLATKTMPTSPLLIRPLATFALANWVPMPAADEDPKKKKGKKPLKRSFFMVYPRMDMTLLQFLDVLPQMTPTLSRSIMHQILSAVKVLHGSNLVHLDVKPENILLSSECPSLLQLADFDHVQHQADIEKKEAHTDSLVTIWYRGPEFVFGDRKPTQALDMWSVGCIFAQLWSRFVLGHRQSPFQFDANRQGKYPEQHLAKAIVSRLGLPNARNWPELTSDTKTYKNYAKWFGGDGARRGAVQPLHSFVKEGLSNDKDGMKLLLGLLEYNPRKRLTVDEALAHPYFRPLRDLA